MRDSKSRGPQRASIEERFGKWADHVTRHRWLVLVMAALATGRLSAGIVKLRIETSPESLLKRSDPALAVYDQFRAEFGSNDVTLLMVVSDEKVFSLPFLTRLYALHNDLDKGLPIDGEVTSLINARVVRGTESTLDVGQLFESWPPTAGDIRRAESLAATNPLYRNVLLSSDGRYATVAIELKRYGVNGEAPPILSTSEGARFTEWLSAVVAKHRSQGFEIHVTGRHPVTTAIMRALEGDMLQFTSWAFAVTGAVLALLFRRITGVLIPLLTVGLSLFATFATMGLLGIAVTPASQILPSFLLAVGICDSVHLLVLFYARRSDNEPAAMAVRYSLAHAGVAVVMTSATTIVCLLSFLFTDLGLIAEFGMTSALGVFYALLYTLTLLPALLAIVPTAAGHSRLTRCGTLTKLLVRTGTDSARHPQLVIVAWTVAVAVALVGALHLRFAHHPVQWLPRGDPTRTDVFIINDKLHGGMFYEITADSGNDGGLYEPDVMRRIDEMRRYLESTTIAGVTPGRAISVVDVVKETHRALNSDDQTYFAVPPKREIIAQEMMLFEMSGSDDVSERVDTPFRKARITTLVPMSDGMAHRSFLDATRSALEAIGKGALRVVVTGQASLDVRAYTALAPSMASSYLLSILLLLPLVASLTGSARLGLLMMFPNLCPICVGLGLSYVAGIPLDMFTMLVGSLAIGVAVDDTIHFVYNFKRHYAEVGDAEEAVRRTLLATGKALFVTSAVLVLAFALFTAASMTSVSNFGVVTVAVIATAFLADVTLSPAILTLFTGRTSRTVSVVRYGQRNAARSVECIVRQRDGTRAAV